MSVCRRSGPVGSVWIRCQCRQDIPTLSLKVRLASRAKSEAVSRWETMLVKTSSGIDSRWDNSIRLSLIPASKTVMLYTAHTPSFRASPAPLHGLLVVE
jgi:hypothetical protein